MKQFEYMYITHEDIKTLNKLGKDGWVLTAIRQKITEYDGAGGFKYFFIREIENETV